MNLSRLSTGVRRRWMAVVLTVSLTVLLAAAYAITRPVNYAAQAQVFVRVATSQSDLTQLNQGSDYTRGQVTSYVDLVTSPIVLQKVIGELSLKESVADLTARVRVDNPLNTVLLNVQVMDPSPVVAARIANRIVVDFGSFIETIETPSGRASAPVAVSVTRPATTPTTPVGSGPVTYIVLGFLLGLFAGVGVALLRDGLDTTVRTSRDVEQITGHFPLGVVLASRQARRRPLIAADEQSRRAEVFRALRTNIQFVGRDAPPKVIVVTSALAGEGRTTAAYNLATVLAANGLRVALVEGDLRKPSLEQYLGLTARVGLTSVLSGSHRLADALQTRGPDDVLVLPAGPAATNPSELLNSVAMDEVMQSLRERTDMVIVDSPPLLAVTDGAVLSSAADGAILVVRAGSARADQIETALRALGGVHATLIGTLLNAADRSASQDLDYSFAVQGPAAPVGPVSLEQLEAPRVGHQAQHALGSQSSPPVR